MNIYNKKLAVAKSVLDKLIDVDPNNKYELAGNSHQLLEELYQSVRRDLENLLNTRAAGITWPKEWNILNTSLFSYGIPNFMHASLLTTSACNTFCNELASIIQRFETRFKNVQVKLIVNDDFDRTLRIRIEGLLCIEPDPKAIIFDSILEPATNRFSIMNNSKNS